MSFILDVQFRSDEATQTLSLDIVSPDAEAQVCSTEVRKTGTETSRFQLKLQKHWGVLGFNFFTASHSELSCHPLQRPRTAVEPAFPVESIVIINYEGLRHDHPERVRQSYQFDAGDPTDEEDITGNEKHFVAGHHDRPPTIKTSAWGCTCPTFRRRLNLYNHSRLRR